MNRLTIRSRMLVMGIGGILSTVLVLVSVAVWQTGDLASLARRQSDELIGDQLDTAARGVTNLIAAQAEAVTLQVGNNLQVARRLARDGGRDSGAQA